MKLSDARKYHESLHVLSECHWRGLTSADWRGLTSADCPALDSLASIDPVLTPSSITSKTRPRNVCVTAGSRVKPTFHQRTAMPCARPGWSSTCAAIGPMRRRIGRRRMCWSGKSNCRAAKMVVASITSCRTAAVRNQQSEEESNRQNLLTQPAD